jgi:hypothetical protein
MRNRRIELTSNLLKDHFCDDSVMLDQFEVNYQAIKRVLDNPEKFPNADIDQLIALEEQFIIETPMELILEEINAH